MLRTTFSVSKLTEHWHLPDIVQHWLKITPRILVLGQPLANAEPVCLGSFKLLQLNGFDLRPLVRKLQHKPVVEEINTVVLQEILELLLVLSFNHYNAEICL